MPTVVDPVDDIATTRDPVHIGNVPLCGAIDLGRNISVIENNGGPFGPPRREVSASSGLGPAITRWRSLWA